MLEVGDATTLNEDQWKRLAALSRMPKGVAEFFASERCGDLRQDSRRRFHRKPLRGIGAFG